MVTWISTVAVSDPASVAVQRKVAVRDSGEASPEAENVVAAELALVIVIESPETLVHAYVYGPVPPEAVAVTVAVVRVEVNPTFWTSVSSAETVSEPEAVRESVTLTSTVNVAATLSVTVQRIVAVADPPAESPVA
jgi:hypothetical protein